MTRFIVAISAVAAAATLSADSSSHWNGGRTVPVHRFAPRDANGERVLASAQHPRSISTVQTCSQCHDVDAMKGASHFRTGLSHDEAAPSVEVEPWFWADDSTGTAIPLSLRGQAGAYSPNEFGLSCWQWTKMFGRTFPGGGTGSDERAMASADGPRQRWTVTGPLEPNCFACHQQRGYDSSEWARQVLRENWRGAATAASGIAAVDGMNERLDDTWDVESMPDNPDDHLFRVPEHPVYDPARFDAKGRCTLDLGRPRNENCLACHSVSQKGMPSHAIEGDVHLKRGMKCVDCHTNGIDRIDTTMHGRLIRFTGKVSDLIDGTLPDTFFVQSGDRNMSVELAGLNPIPSFPIGGAEVEITGLCLAEFENDRTHRTIPRFRRYVVLPRTADDIRVLKCPPWWTPARLFLVIAFLAAALVAVLVWNRTLRILSERRGRQLYREQLGHVLAEKKTEERGRLAVELHDSISQTLTGVAMQVDAASQADSNRPGSARPYLDTAKMLLASCRHELRCCIWDLRSRTFEEKDMKEAIVRTVRPHIGDIDLEVRFDAPRHDLSESTIHTILRIVRELSSNAVRHGDATSLRIDGECSGSTLRFSVEDNGCGFDTSLAGGAKTGHFGLQGIRERLKAFNGHLTIKSLRGNGTKATVIMEAPELKDRT